MAQDQKQYDFIFNPEKGSKKPSLSKLLPSPANKTQRIIFLAVGGVILLMVLFIVFSLVLSFGKEDENKLVSLAQQHVEIVRVADIGIEKARGPEAINLASTTKLALQSSQRDLVEVVNDIKKVDNKLLSAGRDSETDQVLQTAEQRNRFDEAFLEIMNNQLSAYRQDLKEVYDNSSSEKNKQVYSTIFNQVTALLPEQATEE